MIKHGGHVEIATGRAELSTRRAAVDWTTNAKLRRLGIRVAACALRRPSSIVDDGSLEHLALFADTEAGAAVPVEEAEPEPVLMLVQTLFASACDLSVAHQTLNVVSWQIEQACNEGGVNHEGVILDLDFHDGLHAILELHRFNIYIIYMLNRCVYGAIVARVARSEVGQRGLARQRALGRCFYPVRIPR